MKNTEGLRQSIIENISRLFEKLTPDEIEQLPYVEGDRAESTLYLQYFQTQMEALIAQREERMK